MWIWKLRSLETALLGLSFAKSEVIPVIAQDEETGDMLVLAYMNQEARNDTLSFGSFV